MICWGVCSSLLVHLLLGLERWFGSRWDFSSLLSSNRRFTILFNRSCRCLLVFILQWSKGCALLLMVHIVRGYVYYFVIGRRSVTQPWWRICAPVRKQAFIRWVYHLTERVHQVATLSTPLTTISSWSLPLILLLHLVATIRTSIISISGCWVLWLVL